MKEQTKDVRAMELLQSAAAASNIGDYEKAIVDLKHLLERDARHEIALGMLAALYAQIGMVDRASEYFRKVLDLNRNNILARFQLGLLQFNQGHAGDALDTWEPLLADKQDFMAHFHSGLALMQLNQHEHAQRMFAVASKTMPQSHALRADLGRLLSGKSS